MATSVRLTRSQRRARLIAAAEKAFGSKGYRHTEVSEIVAGAGVTKPMLYRHFRGGKAEIFLAVLDKHIEGLLRAIWEAMASAEDPRERLHRGLHGYLGFAEENPDGFRMLATTSELDTLIGDRLREARDSIARGLTNTISDVMRGAGLPTDGAPIYAYALLGGVESVVDWWLVDKTLERETLVDYLLAFVWRGFDGLPRDPTKIHQADESARRR